MPEVDLTSVGAYDPKVSSENHAKINDYKTSPTLQQVIPTTLHPDHASESFFLSKETEIDRLDRNSVLDRNASGKGCNTSISTNSNPIHISSGSHRYSGNLTSLIALPKSQKQNYAEVKNRRHCRTSSVRLFPKRSEQARGKQVVVLSEPGSPKVSCIGRVRSRKDKSRRGKNRKKDSEPDLVRVKSVKGKRYGFWKHVRSIFRFKENKLECEKSQCGEEYMMVFKRSFSSKKKREFYLKNNGDCGGSSEMSPVEPPGLGGMKRFASGRKSDAWAGDVEVDGAESEPLDRSGRANIWQRREVGPPVEIDIHRDWRTVGPASV